MSEDKGGSDFNPKGKAKTIGSFPNLLSSKKQVNKKSRF